MNRTTLQSRRRADRGRKGRGEPDAVRRSNEKRETSAERIDLAPSVAPLEDYEAGDVCAWPRYLPAPTIRQEAEASEPAPETTAEEALETADQQSSERRRNEKSRGEAARSPRQVDGGAQNTTSSAETEVPAPDSATAPQPIPAPSDLTPQAGSTASADVSPRSADEGASPESQAKDVRDKRKDDPEDQDASGEGGNKDADEKGEKKEGKDDERDKKSKDSKDEKGKKDKTGAGGSGGRGRSLGVIDIADEEAAVEDAFPEELVVAGEQSLEVRELDWSPIEPHWTASAELPSDALPTPQTQSKPASSPSPQSTAEKSAPGAGDGEAKKTDSKPAPPPRPSQAEAQRKPEEDARAEARRAYASLAQNARREMAGFVGRANDTMSTMATRYLRIGESMLSSWHSDRDGLRMAVDRACFEVESVAAFALLQLDTASSNAAVAIRQAGASAFGLISARETSATQEIDKVVSGLVAGPVGVYDNAIKQTKAAGEAAIRALNEFRDNKATNYPLKGKALAAAVNESLHARIPRWSDSEAVRLKDRLDKKVEAWGKSRDTTSCQLTCNFGNTLRTQHASLVVEGRKAVSKSLSQARSTLARQASDGRKTLLDQRRSLMQQIRVQGRATESRLSSQIRTALGVMRQEAQGAVNGVRGAARGALPSFSRPAQGFEQTLRAAAPKGAGILKQSTERGTDGAMQSIRRTSVDLDGRLSSNRDKLSKSMDGKETQQRLQRSQQLAEHEAGQSQRVAQGRNAMDQSVAGMVVSFDSMADTVTQSASQWVQPLDVHMAATIKQQQAQASAKVQEILHGKTSSGNGDGSGTANATGDGSNADAAGEGASCNHCAGGEGQQSNAGGGGSEAPKGLQKEMDDERKFFEQRATPATFFDKQISQTNKEVVENLEKRATNIAGKFEGGFAGTVDEEGAIAVLRGLTKLKGWALDFKVYPNVIGGGMLDDDLEYYLSDDPDDLAACRAYLKGNAVEGARLELKHSTGVFNDDEARIEAVMRSLSPEQLGALGRAAPGTMNEVRDALGGTDLKVFEALERGDYALADAYRMKDKIDDAREDRDNDAVHTAIEQYTGSPDPNDWRSSDQAQLQTHQALMNSDTPPTAEQLSQSMADQRRTAVVAALGGIVAESVSANDVTAALDPNVDMSTLTQEQRNQQLTTARAIAYVTRGVDVYVNEPGHYEDGRYVGGGGRIVNERMTGANRDLAAALLRHGDGSVDARAARIGVELGRAGGPNFKNLDRATFDSRFMAPHTEVTPEDREAHRRAADEKARVLMLAAQRYAGGEPTPEHFEPGKDQPTDPNAALNDTHVANARARLMTSINERFGSDSVRAQLTAGLLTDARPTGATAALAMQHAMYSKTGTNEELIFHFTERMNRDEVQDMRNAFQQQTGKSLDAELGVYGEGGTFTELSGDDRLRMERAMLGVPRNDKEKFETAAFALEQQRRETGSFGAWLAEGSLADQAMKHNEERLQLLAGGPVSISRRGELISNLPIFDAKGRYTGSDRTSFDSVTHVAQDIAQNYSNRIDAAADLFTTGIAILGAIAAAVITVVTLGAAGPLIAAAVITGLASMAANYAIKGGRYGWEQAAVDLGMTAVQAITAGVGAQLGAAAQVASKGAQAATQMSRTVVALSRIFTGNPVLDQIIVGAITGGIGGLGGAVFNEQTWDSKDPVGGLFAGLIKGAAGGAATAALTNTIETLASKGADIARNVEMMAAKGLLGRGLARVGSGVNSMLTASTGGGALRSGGAMIMRGTARAVLSGAGGMVGKGAELATDAALGRYKGDVGDAFMEMGHAGLQAAIQGIGEGMAEAKGQGIHNRRVAAAEASIAKVRNEMGLEPLHPSTLKAAAEDLLFLNKNGRLGGDGFAKQVNLDHVSTHGGMMPTVVERFPSPAVQEAMRSELLRHVPEAQRAELADVPIRVMSAEEFSNFTRSQSGHAVTIIENGHPVVVVREGVSIAHLANEGPHIVQARERGTRERVAQLDESKLAKWDSLDLDTQIDLYRTKIDLEIDAHERIARSLAAENPEGPDAIARHAAEVEHNEATLRNLRARAEEVANLSPELRDAIDSGLVEKPQYLDQPARMFSKEDKAGRAAKGDEDAGTAEERRTAEILEVMLETVAEHRRNAAKGGLVDDDMQSLPDAPVKLPGERRTDVVDYDRSRRPPGFDSAARAKAREAFGEMLADVLRGRSPGNALTAASLERLEPHQLLYVLKHGKLPPGVEFHHLLSVADFPEFAHRPDTGLALPERVHDEAGHAMNPRRPLEAATLLDPDAETRTQGFHNDPEAVKHSRDKQADIASGTRSTGDVDRDIAIDMRQRVRDAETKLRFAEQRAARPNANDADRARVDTARRTLQQAREAEAQVFDTTARAQLLRHVPENQRAKFADVEIRVLSDADYRAQMRSESGPVATLIENGKPVVVMREGTPLKRLADEGPHLMQIRERATRAATRLLDEATMSRWDQLYLDTQIELYQTKIRLEIDAHERIARSLAKETADSPEAAARIAADIKRNETTLRNLRARADEVDTMSPERRAAIRDGKETKPQYLDQPARLFSKDPKQKIVFEPFVGGDLQSPMQLQQRYPDADVIVGEAKILPKPEDIATFQLGGGKFVVSRFGESLPNNHVDVMHVRYPMPHDKQGAMATSLEEAIRISSSHETLINLAPTALKKIVPGGRMEVVYDEVDIHHELDRVAKLRWTDPADGKAYRFEPEGQPRSEPRAVVSPHSGFGTTARLDAFVVSFRKVEAVDVVRSAAPIGIPSTAGRPRTGPSTSPQAQSLSFAPLWGKKSAGDSAQPIVSKYTSSDAELRAAVLRHVPKEQHAEFDGIEIRVLEAAEFQDFTGSKSGNAVTVIENGRPVIVVRDGAPLSHLADEGPHLMQFGDKTTQAKMLRLDEDTMSRWDGLDLDTQIELYQSKIALEIDAHEHIARALAQETPDTPAAKAMHKADVERNETTLRNLRARAKEVANITPKKRMDIELGVARRPEYLDQPARLFSKKNKKQGGNDENFESAGHSDPESARRSVARQFSIGEKDVAKLMRRLQSILDEGGDIEAWINENDKSRSIELRRKVAELLESERLLAVTEDLDGAMRQEGDSEPVSVYDSDGAFIQERHDNYVDGLPFNHKEQQFRQFVSRLQKEFSGVGYGDVMAFMQGSAASGYKHNNGNPIELNRERGVLPKDYDVAIVSEKISQAARDLGIDIHKGPLTDEQILLLGLSGVQEQLTLASKGGIQVNFKIYPSVEDVYDYGKTIPFSKWE